MIFVGTPYYCWTPAKASEKLYFSSSKHPIFTTTHLWKEVHSVFWTNQSICSPGHSPTRSAFTCHQTGRTQREPIGPLSSLTPQGGNRGEKMDRCPRDAPPQHSLSHPEVSYHRVNRLGSSWFYSHLLLWAENRVSGFFRVRRKEKPHWTGKEEPSSKGTWVKHWLQFPHLSGTSSKGHGPGSRRPWAGGPFPNDLCR